MIYVSLDIETTGLDPLVDQILSIGAIIEDTEKILPYEFCPKFHIGIIPDKVTGSLFAINMNRELIQQMVDYEAGKQIDGIKFIKKEEAALEFYYFLYENNLIDSQYDELNVNVNRHIVVREYKGEMRSYPVPNLRTKPTTITAAGKNVGVFDKPFLEQLPNWKAYIKIRSRIIDPAILYVDWKTDTELPSLSVCKERAGFGDIITHNALEDAWDTLRVIRSKY